MNVLKYCADRIIPICIKCSNICLTRCEYCDYAYICSKCWTVCRTCGAKCCCLYSDDLSSDDRICKNCYYTSIVNYQ